MSIASKPTVFISYSSQDKEFAAHLARSLRRSGFDVWYDEWEISIGDSIVDKVFDGIKDSDCLVIVLSPVSVSSSWVKEELNTAVMRRISERNIRILPVLKDTCEIPSPLRHLRYADFRGTQEDAFHQLLESLAPGNMLWRSLSHLYDHLCLLSDDLMEADLNDVAADKILRLYSLLESALDVRTEIEFRKTRERMKDLSFFEKIGFLVDKGVDVRSRSWNALLTARASLTHSMKGEQASLHALAYMFRERYDTHDLGESLKRGMNRLKEIMRMICFEKWDIEEWHRRQQE